MTPYFLSFLDGTFSFSFFVSQNCGGVNDEDYRIQEDEEMGQECERVYQLGFFLGCFIDTVKEEEKDKYVDEVTKM